MSLPQTPRSAGTTRSVLFTILSLLVCVGACQHEEAGPPPARPPAPITVTQAKRLQNVPVYLDEIGTAMAIETVDILPQVDGQIIAINFTDGQDVKKGDLLFTIDPRPYEARVAQLRADRADTQANLALAKVQLKRYADLRPTGGVTASEYDIQSASVDSWEAKVLSADAAINVALVDMEYTRIHSPIDGRTGARQVDLGNVVKSLDKPLLRIQRFSPIYVDFTTVEANLDRVRQAMRDKTLIAEVTVPRQIAAPYTGELTFLDNAVQAQSGRLRLRATLPNVQRELWPGQFVNVRLILQRIPEAVTVPVLATQMSQQGPYVYVVHEDPKSHGTTAEQRFVQLGQRQGDDVVVATGLQGGEAVVLTGQLTVTPGGPVRILEPATGTQVNTGPSAAATTGPTEMGGGKSDE